MSTHYPKRRSNIKRARTFGFRARMRTKNGRKMINRKRRVGRSVNVRKWESPAFACSAVFASSTPGEATRPRRPRPTKRGGFAVQTATKPRRFVLHCPTSTRDYR